MKKQIQIFLSICLFFFSFSALAQAVVDCSDPANAGLPICKVEGLIGGKYYNCGDGIDNDGDGVADCLDGKCAGYALCAGETDCGNGIDDDGDGFIDYYDGDCLNDPNNPNDYIVVKPDCEEQPVGNSFDIEVAWQSANKTSSALGMPMVADIDKDGIPEVITSNGENGDIYILDGRDGSIEKQVNIGSNTFAYPAVADVNGDGYGEIFMVNQSGTIRALKYDLTNYWASTQTSCFTTFGRALGMADFDQDGTVELYQVNEIRNAQDGSVIIAGSHGTGKYPSANNWETELNSTSVAVDILPNSYCPDCQGLELVVGHIIYSVDITNKKLTERFNMNNAATKPAGYPAAGYFPKYAGWSGQNYSTTSIVDYNEDGSLDVLLGGTTGSKDGPTTVFFWDIQNDVVKSFVVSRLGSGINASIKGNFRDLSGGGCGNGEQCTWVRGVGTLNIANIDADPELECTFMSGSSLYALDNNFNLEWANHTDFWESSSGFTGTTVFDFDGDGSSEIVYRDEVNLYIVDGTTGIPLNGILGTDFCSSQTQGEYPIVADVDGDGETEIVVSCGRDQNTFGSSPATSGTRVNGHIKVYKAAGGNYWVPARSIWNQFSYFNVNVNDNLTIPRTQQAHHLNFSQICNDPNAPKNSFSLNKFLNQSPRISYCGQLVFPAPKLDYADDAATIAPPVCPDNNFTVKLTFENNGDADVNIPIPVSFYSNDPQQSYGNADPNPYLQTIDINIAGGLKVGQKIDTTLTVTGARGNFTLYASLNDIGPFDKNGAALLNADFYPLDSLNGPVRECDNLPTIVSKQVSPFPFDVLAKVISDNRNCPGSMGNNGEVQVFAADGSVLPSSDYEFAWYNVNTGTNIGTDALVTDLDSGTYRVEVIYNNGAFTCQGKQDTVTVVRFEDWPADEKVTIQLLQKVSSCKPGTADGKAQVLINGVVPSDADYDIVWIDEQNPNQDTLAVGVQAAGLKQLLYKASVTNKLTGCSSSELIDMTLQVPMVLDTPVVSGVSNCSSPNGSITAKLLSGAKSSYEYILIQHSPIQDTITTHNNGAFTKLDVGTYEIRAYDPATECGLYSEGIFTDLAPKKTIDFTLAVVKEQTACEAPYNGQLSATVTSAGTYSYAWYRGFVDPANLVGTTATTLDTLSTNITDQYIVVITNTGTTCSVTGNIQLTETIQVPTISYSITGHQTTCNPNGSVQVTANPAGLNYEFYLLQGSDTLATNTSGTFNGLAAGPYVAGLRNLDTRCSATLTPIFNIQDNVPFFGTVTFNKIPRTNCDPAAPDGALEAVATGNIADYSFKWFIGVDTANAVSPQPVVPQQLIGIDGGDYVLKITNTLSGCDTLVYTDLTDLSANYQDTIKAVVTQHQNYCRDDKKNGSIRAYLAQSASGPVPDSTKYNFYWYQGRKTDLENGTATLIPGVSTNLLDSVDYGWYSVRAERNDGFGCAAVDTMEVRVLDMRDYPVANINIIPVVQTSCDSNNPNGGLKGNVDGNTTDYVFTWYQIIGGVDKDITVNNPGAVINGFTVDNIGTGTYVLEVEHIETGCTGREQIYLQDNIIKGSEIKLVLSTTDATFCSPANGVAEVTDIQISEDGGTTFTLTDTLANYDFQWYEGTDTSMPILSGSNPTAITAKLENVEPGDYTVVATSQKSSCASISYTTTVNSALQSALTFDFGFKEQSNCVSPNGGIWVENVTGGSGSYSYQWYKGTTFDYPILVGGTNDTLSFVSSDKYTIRITDDSTGCSAIGTRVLGSQVAPVPPATLRTPIQDVTTCNNMAYDGMIVAEVDSTVKADSYPFHADTDFFFYWFEGKNVRYIDPSGNLDYPDNYDVLNGAPPVPGDNKATISNLAPGFYTVVIVDAKDYIVSGGIDSLECKSDPRTFEVKAIARKPIAVFTTQTDSMCVGLPSGAATITASKRSGDTTAYGSHDIISATKDGVPFGIPAGNLTTTPDAVAKQTTFTIDNLAEGEYEFQIQDLQTTCDTTIRVNIDSRAEFPNILYTDVKVNQHQTSCNPDNGEVAVINPPDTVGVLADYTFYWHNAMPVDPIADADFVGPVWSGLDSGLYYVYAQHNVTGCISSYQSVEVKYQVTETIVKKTIKQNTNCDATSPNGEMSVEIHEEDDSGVVSTPASGYTFTWYKDGAPYGGAVVNTPAVNSLKSTISGLAPGAYRVTVENNDLQCVVKEAKATIIFNPVLPVFTAGSATVQHVKTCDGDGVITIKEIKENGVTITDTDPAFANYTFEWYQGNLGTLLPDVTNSIGSLMADTYYVYIINTATGGCKSVNNLQIVLKDSSKNPLIYQQEIVDFISCTGVNEGAIEVYGQEFDTTIPALGYQYAWELADGSPMPAGAVYNADSSRVSNLQAGTYSVTVTNKSTGCQNTKTFTIKEKIYYPILLVSKSQDQTYCWGNGAAKVDQVTLKGNPEIVSNYTFEWYEGSLSATPFGASTYGLSIDSLAADSLIAGTYLIKAINTVTGCETFPVQVIIEDNTVPLDVRPYGIIEPVIACDPSNKPKGELSVEVRNSSDFITRWYNGSTITLVADSIPGLGNLLEVKNLIPGSYTVYVEDTVSGCSTTRTYTIEGLAIPLTVSLSTTPYSSCVNPDGRIAANVNGGSGQYDFYWYAGSDITTTPIKVTQSTVLDKLTNGLYTVVVQDQIEAECQTLNADVVVEDGRGKEIQVTIVQDFPVTNCDVSKPNGQLTATVAGDISRYNFFWYAGRDVSKRPIAKGITASNLTAGEYTLIARDKVTGCLSAQFRQNVDAQQDTEGLTAPEVKVLSPVTRCTKPNGSAIAVLDSTLIDPNVDYEYIWTDENGKKVFSSIRTNIVTGLKTGTYWVSVRNTSTGCYNETAEVQIKEEIYTPEFEIITTPSTCMESTGTITLELKEPIQIVDIEWTTPYGFASGFYLINQPPGEYEVKITDANGCIITKKATIKTNLYVYNGVSPNGDNKNDKFIISCIDNFERKTVRIYNRSGALVYENQDYDNQISYFEGQGNRGLYIGGEKLPDGTYFYIIDKHDGEEPVSGYLELLR